MGLVELRIGDQTIRYDRECTRRVYTSIPTGDADVCGCLHCRNFAAQRDQAYPESFLQLLDHLGVDPAKESEVYYLYTDSKGKSEYGGWFHLVGEIVEPGCTFNERAQDNREFQFWFWFTQGLPANPEWDNETRIELAFITTVDWVLPESPE